MTSIEASHTVLQWTALALSKLGQSDTSGSYEAVKVVLELIAAASESCRRHPDFEDGFVYSQTFASSIGDNDGTTMTTSRSSMTQSQQQQEEKQNQKQSNARPLIPGPTLGKASLALDVL
eukprot:CAMPEP_0172446618 /NCGR_PEP_ID=MMETSP1065-20121228/6178_1 /TAXON_ID=265537 /ORGANISM="Amphiprora paludosa, Strain CCMP125" /LENGTH=119 /DNA_ID=CAMNT_0013197779 /DNA_START=195 /DNA_END=550 /DNA_ORIENTATION=+